MKLIRHVEQSIETQKVTPEQRISRSVARVERTLQTPPISVEIVEIDLSLLGILVGGSIVANREEGVSVVRRSKRGGVPEGDGFP